MFYNGNIIRHRNTTIVQHWYYKIACLFKVMYEYVFNIFRLSSLASYEIDIPFDTNNILNNIVYKQIIKYTILINIRRSDYIFLSFCGTHSLKQYYYYVVCFYHVIILLQYLPRDKYCE